MSKSSISGNTLTKLLAPTSISTNFTILGCVLHTKFAHTSCRHFLLASNKVLQEDQAGTQKKEFPEEWISFSCNQLEVFYLHFCLIAKEFQNIQDFQHDMH
jgi:hypothetical protein